MWRKKKLFSTQCKTLLTIFTYTMLHLVYPPKFCIIIVSDFILGITLVPSREIEGNGYPKFGVGGVGKQGPLWSVWK